MGDDLLQALELRLKGMKRVENTGFTNEAEAAGYFQEKEGILDEMGKTLESVKSATGTEIEAVKATLKEFRTMLKSSAANPKELTRQEVQYQLGKAIAAAWTGNMQALGELKCTPNLKSDNWNNPKDFQWTAEKGFQLSNTKAALGEPMGNMATNEQFLINPIYENAIMQDAAKQSVMMPLVKHRPMTGPSIFLPQRDRGGVELKWLTAYGQKIDGSKPQGATRVELKAYTLAGFIPWYDEFEEDVFVDLGAMFMDEFTETYALEFDKQCLLASNAPFTGAFNAADIKQKVISGAAAAALTYKDLREAVLMVPAEERKDCRWFFHESVLAHVTGIVDANGRPVWRGPTDGKPGTVDGYAYTESHILPQMGDIVTNSSFAIFMNPKRIIHGNRKGVEIKRFDATTEALEYGELFLRFRKRDGFLVTRAKGNMVLLKTGA
ncbi:phage major capsid protein [Treponema zuelzerae]|uniref:Phage major capsid protein n=1 Tax=Teretinema zuelzerae TaxID=156 RepID=A0AAE3EFR6_9SPIR|nr:phage major capsid protein [Teretinema zuelzerae]MCD1653596.1 phage major capsid protein [Teretinema zuelzerae]